MYRTAWRLGLRDLLVHRWRSLLIVLLVTLPVAAVVAGSVGVQSITPTPAERATRALGTAQAELAWLPTADDGRVCPQDPMALGNVYCSEADWFTPGDVPAALADLVPGHRVVDVRVGGVEVLRPLASGRAFPTLVDATVVDVGAPEFAGRWDLVAGSPATGQQVVVSRPLARAFGLAVGDALATEQGDFAVAGIVAAPELKWPAVFLPAGHALADGVTDERAFVVGDQPITWDQVQAFNQRGVAAVSRAVLLDPPYAPDEGADRLLMMVGLVGALGGLMVMFVAGSAFAVGVRASRRQLGLLGAVGAPDRVLRRLVLGQAVLLGGIGALLGVLVGVAVGRLGLQWLAATDQAAVWGFHVPWVVLGLTVAAGVGACVLAAWGPARSVAKVDAIEAVRSAEVATPRARVPWLGIALVVLGIVVVVVAAWLFRTDPTREWWEQRTHLVTVVSVGIVAVTLGLALSLHPLIALVARVIPRRPLAVRLAVRDVDRSRGRVVPAVAAVVTATVLGTVVAGLILGSEQGMQARAAWRVHPTHVLVHVVTDDMDPQVARSALEQALGTPVTATLVGTLRAAMATPEENQCPTAGGPPDPDDWRCAEAMGGYPSVAVGDGAELAVLLGREPLADELADLRAGVLLTSWRGNVAGGRALVNLDVDGGGDDYVVPPEALVSVPARLVDVAEAAGWSMLSKARATELGLPEERDVVVLDVGRSLTPAEVDDIDVVLRDLGFWGRTLPRDPDQARWSWAWLITGVGGAVVLAVVGLVTALGVADGRRDEGTLASVGAPAGLRRATTAGQVLVVAGLGSLLGAVVGVLGLVALMGVQPTHAGLGPAVPWWQLLALVVGLPVVAALLAWLVTPPSRALAHRVLT